jgi:diguanylate cyclase (GGDEF)-like protein
VAERIGKVLAKRSIPHPSSPTAAYVTVSIGFTGVTNPELTRQFSWQDIVRHADEALYAAKRQGRNRALEWSVADHPNNV